MLQNQVTFLVEQLWPAAHSQPASKCFLQPADADLPEEDTSSSVVQGKVRFREARSNTYLMRKFGVKTAAENEHSQVCQSRGGHRFDGQSARPCRAEQGSGGRVQAAVGAAAGLSRGDAARR